MKIARLLLLLLPFLSSPLSHAQVPGWTPTSKSPPGVGARSGHDGIWTGKEIIIWGGSFGSNGLGSGARYDVKTNTWRPMTLVDVPRPYLGGNSAVWAGEPVNRMIIFGGSFPPLNRDGGMYDPETDRWTKIEIDGDRTKNIPVPPNVPTFRSYHSAVWSGKEMIVWGGHCNDTCYRNDGAAYDPLANTWRPISTPTFLAGRKDHTAIWTGTHMLIWGGNNAGGAFNNGGLYDPERDEWKQITLTDAPVARIWYGAVWTGTEMIVWGGQGGGLVSRADGKIYDPVSDRWRPMSTYGLALNAKKQALGKDSHSAVWTGEEMIVWGGRGSTPFKGYRYSPRNDQWLPITNENAPTNRIGHTAVWGDGAMMIWAGLGQRVSVFDGPYAGATGGVYRPGCGLYVKSPKVGDRVDREVTFELGTGTITGAPQRAQLIVDGVAHGDWTPVSSDGRVKFSLSDEMKGSYKLRVKSADATGSECLSEEIPVVVGPIIKTLMIIFDPKLDFVGQTPIRTILGWNDPIKMTDEYITTLKSVSGDFAEYKLLQPVINVDGSFKNINGHVMNDAEFFNRGRHGGWANLAWNAHGSTTNREIPLGNTPSTVRYAQSFKTWGAGLKGAKIVVRKVGNPQLPIKISVRDALNGQSMCNEGTWCAKAIPPAEVSAAGSTIELGKVGKFELPLADSRLYYFTLECLDPSVPPDPNNHYMIGYVWETVATPGQPQYTDVEAELFQDTLSLSGSDLNLMLNFSDRADYKYILEEKIWDGRTQTIAADVNAGLVDEVIIWGPPFNGVWEAAMMGPGAFDVNGTPWTNIQTTRAFVVMGFNYQRTVTEMVHNYGHRTERTMRHVYRGWQNYPYDKVLPASLTATTNWDKFSVLFGTLSTGPVTACGAIHFPPNVNVVHQPLDATSEEYKYGLSRRVLSNCDEWLNYPYHTAANKLISATAWGGNEAGFLKWWFKRLPKKAGRNTDQSDMKLNNWWRYVVEPGYYTDPNTTRELNVQPVP